MFLAAFVFAGLNWRLRWIVLPDAACRIAAGVFLAVGAFCVRFIRKK